MCVAAVITRSVAGCWTFFKSKVLSKFWSRGKLSWSSNCPGAGPARQQPNCAPVPARFHWEPGICRPGTRPRYPLPFCPPCQTYLFMGLMLAVAISSLLAGCFLNETVIISNIAARN